MRISDWSSDVCSSDLCDPLPFLLERVIWDSAFRDRLRLAYDLKVSDKRLPGWEPTETHVHEYDAKGRLVRTVVTREPEWDHAEVAKMPAFAEYEAGLCACGLHKSIADTDPDLDMPERNCPVCAGLARSWGAYHTPAEGGHPASGAGTQG